MLTILLENVFIRQDWPLKSANLKQKKIIWVSTISEMEPYLAKLVRLGLLLHHSTPKWKSCRNFLLPNGRKSCRNFWNLIVSCFLILSKLFHWNVIIRCDAKISPGKSCQEGHKEFWPIHWYRCLCYRFVILVLCLFYVSSRLDNFLFSVFSVCQRYHNFRTSPRLWL